MKQLTKKQLKIMLQTSEASDYIEPIKADGEEFNLTVRRYISIDDQAAIVRDVVDAIIGDDYYHPEYLDAVFAKAVIGAYSNIDIGMVDNKLLSDILYSVADTASARGRNQDSPRHTGGLLWQLRDIAALFTVDYVAHS